MKAKEFRKNPNLFIFILMPFDNPLTIIYENYIKKPLKSKGFTIKRADDIYKPNPILEDILDNLSKADLIIAELTGRNPNVFYELGRAHEQGKYVIQICQNTEDIPFDLRHIRTIIYENSSDGCEKLEKTIFKFIKDYLDDREEKPKVEYSEESRAHFDEEALFNKLAKLEKEFDQNIISQNVKSDLNMRIIAYPLLNTGELFKISQISELKDYLEIENKIGPLIDSFPTQIFNNLSVTREGLQYISSSSFIGSILIQREGLVLYDWRYGLKKDPDNETLPVQFMSAYVLGFLYFLSKFFNKLKYLGAIKIIFNVLNIPNWKYSSLPRFMYDRPKSNFQHSSFKPYECICTIKELSSKEGKQRLLQEMFNEILLGYGDSRGFKLGDNLTAFLEKN